MRFHRGPSSIYDESGLVLIRFTGFLPHPASSSSPGCLLCCAVMRLSVSPPPRRVFHALYNSSPSLPEGSIYFTKAEAVNRRSDFATTLLCHWIICQQTVAHFTSVSWSHANQAGQIYAAPVCCCYGCKSAFGSGGKHRYSRIDLWRQIRCLKAKDSLCFRI